ncbi:MAG: LysM peptidoglycan-binding domain-containing protein [Duncaniella sp.]|nr:LysM peptidoglycan-binding domain-containing protein [Duncaniella sp.]
MLLTAVTAIGMDAAVKDLPVKRVNGKLYHYYEVAPRETVYSLLYKLDINREEMLRHNPSVADGLKAGMTLFFPVDEGEGKAQERTVVKQTAGRVITHDVEKGETIFGIARKYNISTEDVISQNPVLKDGLKAGQTITLTLPDDSADAESVMTVTNVPASAPEVVPVMGYIVKKKETFYSIAVAHGLSVAALEAANPGVTSLKEGQVLNIPVPAAVPSQATVVNETYADGGAVDERDVDVATDVSQKDSSEVSIAVMLPFMLAEETPSKGAARYTEFYKGFLLAVDSLRNGGVPVHVSAFDTDGSVVKVQELLSSPSFKNFDAVIAPDNASQLAFVSEYGKNNEVKILNTFLVKDESYLTNPWMMQGNLPSAQMYERAISALMERLSRSTPVFLTLKGSVGDKADFVADLRKALDEKGQKYIDIEADGKLMPDDLKSLPADGNYFFITSTCRQADLNKLMPAIIEWRDDVVTPVVRLFGYPEWTTFRGETLVNMHNLNTFVYSRFYTDDDSWRTRGIDGLYRRWYGGKMENAVPRQGLLGFDTGMFLIPYLTGCTDRYDGVQNGYFFKKVEDGAGEYNQTLYLINFKPGNVTEKIRL